MLWRALIMYLNWVTSSQWPLSHIPIRFHDYILYYRIIVSSFFFFLLFFPPWKIFCKIFFCSNDIWTWISLNHFPNLKNSDVNESELDSSYGIVRRFGHFSGSSLDLILPLVEENDILFTCSSCLPEVRRYNVSTSSAVSRIRTVLLRKTYFLLSTLFYN